MTDIDERPPQLPQEYYDDLRKMDPRSYEFGITFETANVLARETGHQLLKLHDIFPPLELTPPEGFDEELLIPNGAELVMDQFKGVIQSFSLPEGTKTLMVDAHRLVSDTGKGIRYCDLRPFMTNSVKKDGPTNQSEIDKLDRCFFRDLKLVADSGTPKWTVTGVKGVNYTKLGNTKTRAYWMSITDGSNDDPLFARLGDSGNSPNKEAALYRRIFGKKLTI